jgi:lipopolysaccharide export LptBFGC system permease protein LptF
VTFADAPKKPCIACATKATQNKPSLHTQKSASSIRQKKLKPKTNYINNNIQPQKNNQNINNAQKTKLVSGNAGYIEWSFWQRLYFPLFMSHSGCDMLHEGRSDDFN